MSRFGKELDKFAATFLGAYKQSADAANTRERNRLYAENIAVDNAAAARRLDIAEQNAHALQNHYANMDANSRARINNANSGMDPAEFENLIKPALPYLKIPQAPVEVNPQNIQPNNPISAVPLVRQPTNDTDEDVTNYSQGGVVNTPFYRVAGKAMQHIQDRYALHAYSGGAIPDNSQRHQLTAFQDNSNAISPEMLDALRGKTGSNEESIRQLYDFYAARGDEKTAREAASGVMEAARARSMALGQQSLEALDQQDYSAAAKSLIAAYNEVPDNHTFTGEVNQNGVGRAVIANNENGKPIQQIDLSPQVIAHSAKIFASGSGFYPHMAMAVNSAQPDPKPVARALGGGLMDQGVKAAVGDDEELFQTAVASEEDIPNAQTISSEGTSPAAVGQQPTGMSFIPILPNMSRGQIATVRALNQVLAQRSSAAASDQRVQARSDAGVDAHEKNKYHDTPEYQLEYASSEAEKRYSNPKDPIQKQRLNEELSDLGVRYYDATHPRQRQAAFKINVDDPEGATQYERYLAPFTSELDKLEGLAEKTNVKRADGSAMVDPKKPGVVKLDDMQRQEFLDIANNVHSYSGKSPRQIVRALHQLAYNPEVKPEFNRRTGEWRVGDITLPLESGDLVHLRKINNGVRQRYHMEQRANAAKAALAPEVEAQRENFWRTTGKNSIRNDDGRAAGIPSAGGAALPNFGELPGFDPEARLGVR